MLKYIKSSVSENVFKVTQVGQVLHRNAYLGLESWLRG